MFQCLIEAFFPLCKTGLRKGAYLLLGSEELRIHSEGHWSAEDRIQHQVVGVVLGLLGGEGGQITNGFPAYQMGMISITPRVLLRLKCENRTASS